jgi:hypothetical protein
MASTYTPLGVELMATGENAGTWGTKTNTNLNIIEQISGGYVELSIAGSAGTQAVDKTDGGTGSAVATRVIKFTGTISGNRVITFPVLTENFYLINNGTSGSYTVQLKAASGSGATVTWGTGDKDWKLVYFDGVSTNTGVYLRLGDADNSHYVALQAPSTVASNVTLTLPNNDGDADQFMKTDGSGNLSFATVSGGTSWQAVKTSTFTAVAGEGYFINTTGGAFEMDLPAGSIGDEIAFIDYAGTFDTNALTIDQNGTEKIAGSTDPLTVSTERAANTLVYVDGTQGWLLKNN